MILNLPSSWRSVTSIYSTGGPIIAYLYALRENLKKGADRGIDGELFFPNGPAGRGGCMLTSVKGGDQVGRGLVRDFVVRLSAKMLKWAFSFVCASRLKK